MPDDPLLGQLLDGRYLIHERLGEGGMGSVYRATHVLMDKAVAVKVINAELAHLPNVAKRFEREARFASRLTDPHCISVTDFGRTAEGTLFLVMELLAGEELAARLAREGPLSPRQAIAITGHILKALGHAHDAGVVHRDLKPENVMLVAFAGETDFVKVFDFGIAKIATSDDPAEKLTQSGLVVGTPAYLSPEQALGGEVDQRADLYAVGVMLYEMLAGRAPFGGDTAMDIVAAHLSEPIPALPADRPFPAGLARVVVRAMAKKPAERYQSAAEFQADLAAIDCGVREGALAVCAGTVRRLAAVARRVWSGAGPRRKALMAGAAAALGIFVVAGIALVRACGAQDAPAPVLEVVEAPGVDEDAIRAMLVQADGQIRAGLPGEAEVTLKEALRLSPSQAGARLLLGHALFLTGKRKEAMKVYAEALVENPDLARDVRLEQHLEEGLKGEDSAAQAAQLIAAYRGEEGIALLAGRAASALAGGAERDAARRALIAAEHRAAIDWLASLSADFNEYKSCRKRKEIIAAMVETSDARFLPLLESEKPKAKRKSRFRRAQPSPNECIAQDLKRAIDILGAARDGRAVHP